MNSLEHALPVERKAGVKAPRWKLAWHFHLRGLLMFQTLRFQRTTKTSESVPFKGIKRETLIFFFGYFSLSI